MALKHGVLGLVVQRRGYGYELVQRFNERLGPGWRLNSGALYMALDQLIKDGLIQPAEDQDGRPITRGRTTDRQAPRLTYEATEEGVRHFREWMRQPASALPLREDLHMQIALSRREDIAQLIELTEQRERECLERLEAHAGHTDFQRLLQDNQPWEAVATMMVRDADVVSLAATIDWLRRVREALRWAQEHGDAESS